MNKLFFAVTATASLILLSGCAPTYTPPSNPSKSVAVNIQELSAPMICVDHQWYQLNKNNKGMTKISSSSRIILANNFEESKDYITYTEKSYCMPKISFVPQKGFEYYLNFLQKKKSCQLILLKRAANSLGKYSDDKTAQPASKC